MTAPKESVPKESVAEKPAIVASELGAAPALGRWLPLVKFAATLSALFVASLLAGALSMFGAADGVNTSLSPARVEASLAASVANALAPGAPSLERHNTGMCPGPFRSQATLLVGPLGPKVAARFLARARHRLRVARWTVREALAANDLSVVASRARPPEQITITSMGPSSGSTVQIVVVRPC